MNDSFKIEQTLLRHGIRLMPDEKVIQIIENLKIEQPRIFSKGIIHFVLTILYIISMLLVYVFMSSLDSRFLTYSLGLGLLLIHLVIILKYFPLFFNQPENVKGITIFTNLGIIPPSKKHVGWDQVHNIDIQGDEQDGFLVFDLEPKKITYSPLGDYLWNTQEKSEYILLGGLYDTKETLEQLLVPWKRLGPIAKLEEIKQELIDKYDLEVGNTNSHIETLVGKNNDFNIKYAHKTRFPVSTFKVDITFNQAIPAFLNIYSKNLVTMLKATVSNNSFNTGNYDLDAGLTIEGSHEEAVKKILTRAIKLQLLEILDHATFELRFGEPIRQLQLKPQSIHDDETVLDSMFTTNDGDLPTRFAGNDYLSIEIDAMQSIYDVKTIKFLANACLEIANHFANGLNEIER